MLVAVDRAGDVPDVSDGRLGADLELGGEETVGHAGTGDIQALADEDNLLAAVPVGGLAALQDASVNKYPVELPLNTLIRTLLKETGVFNNK